MWRFSFSHTIQIVNTVVQIIYYTRIKFKVSTEKTLRYKAHTCRHPDNNNAQGGRFVSTSSLPIARYVISIIFWIIFVILQYYNISSYTYVSRFALAIGNRSISLVRKLRFDLHTFFHPFPRPVVGRRLLTGESRSD